MRAVGVAAEEEARKEIAAEGLVFGGERRFVGARAKGDFVLRAQTSGPTRRGARAQTRARAAAGRPRWRSAHGSRRAARVRRGTSSIRRSMPARQRSSAAARRNAWTRRDIEVAGVAKVDRDEFFAALVEGEELKVGGSGIEPRHALGGRAPRARGHDDFEPAEVAAPIAVLAAVVEPQNAQGENAVDGGCGFRLAHADDRVGRGSAQQASAHIGGTKAVLEIHGRAEAIDLRADEVRGSARAPAAADSCGARRRARWVCGGRWWEPVRASAASPRPCAGSSGAGIARAPARRRRCASGCALRSRAAAGSGHATR